MSHETPEQNDGTEREAELVKGVIQGRREALAELYAHYRPRLERIVKFRLDHRLYGRVDSEDVLQEAYMNAEARMGRFLQDSPVSAFIWLRLVVNQTLIDVHRRHFGVQARDARRDVPIHGGWSAESTSVALLSHLTGHLTSPSQAAARTEQAERIDLALSALQDLDREILALRHFEDLTNSEAAQALGISAQAASMRYVRAITRLREVLKSVPGLLDD